MNNVRLQHYEISPHTPTRNISTSYFMPYKKKKIIYAEREKLNPVTACMTCYIITVPYITFMLATRGLNKQKLRS